MCTKNGVPEKGMSWYDLHVMNLLPSLYLTELHHFFKNQNLTCSLHQNIKR